MSTTLRLLILEDNPCDAELEIAALEKAGYTCRWERVETQTAFLQRLHKPNYDLILADYTLPAFDGLTALKLCLERGCELPFIIVSDELGEEVAIESLKVGATDYVLKNHLSRLGPVVQRALYEKEMQRERERLEQEREQLLAAEREQRLLAETLQEVTLALTSQIDKDAVLDEILRQTQRLVPYKTANIMLLKGATLHIARWQGYKPDGSVQLVSNLRQKLSDFPMDNEVVQSKKPIIIYDTHQDPRWVTFDQTAWIRTTLAMPICQRNRVLGLLRLDSDSPGKFTLEDTKRLQPLLSAAAVALEQAHLYRQAQQEIAERKQAEESLRENEARMRSIIDSAVDGIIISDEQGIIEVFNGAAESMFGYKMDEVIGKNINILMPSPEREEHNNYLARYKETGEKKVIDIGCEVVGRRKGGVTFPLELAVSEVYLGRQRVFTGIMRDITKRKLAAEQLHLQAVALETAANAIVITNREGVINWVNPAFTKLTGYTAPEAIGNTLSVLKSKKHSVSFYRELWNTILAGQVWRGEIINRRKNNSLYTEEMTITPVQNESGEITNFIAIKQNVSDRKRAEEKIAKLNEELEQRVADRTRDLSTLYEVTTVASESLNLETTLERSLERMLAAVKSDIGAIHLLDETSQTLRLAAQQGIPPNIVLQLDPVPLDNTLVGWVIEHSKPLVISDLASDPRAPQAAGAAELHYYAGAPMQVRRQVLGVLSIFGGPEQRLNVEEVTLLSSVADQVGVAVENARLRKQAEQTAVMEERSRMGRELHDSITQSLYSLSLFAEWGLNLFEAGDLEGVKQRLLRIEETARQALKEMRRLVYQLRPPALEQDGLAGALQQRLDAVEKRVGIETDLLIESSLELPPFVEETLYYIAQEALNNALNHANASSVKVKIEAFETYVILEVSDDGVGFDLESARDKGGIGLSSMQERAEQLGGSLTILSVLGAGTTITVNCKW